MSEDLTVAELEGFLKRNEKMPRELAALLKVPATTLRRKRALHLDCLRGCLLAEVYEIPRLGYAVLFPGYKLSDEKAAQLQSGDRRGQPTAQWLDSQKVLTLDCDHYSDLPVSASRVRHAISMRHAALIVVPNGHKAL